MDIGVGSIVKLLCCAILVLLSGYFSSAESAYARANKIRLKNIADDGSKKGKKALYIANRFDKALVAILIGNNIVNTACSSLATLVAIELLGDNATWISTIITTAVVFMFGEVIPKSYANANSEKTALAYSGSLGILMKLFTPVSFIFVKLSDFVTMLCGGGQDERISEEELETIIDSVEESGTLNEEQTDLLQNAVDFTKTPVENVMTMREDIVGINIRDTQENILDIVTNTRYSRLLAYDGTVDTVVGVLSVREYLREYLRRGRVNLRRVVYGAKIAAPDAAIDDLFNEMSTGKQQFLVVRENDETVGIATIEDFLEELVGEIWDENDEYDEDFIKLGGNFFSISPKMKVMAALERIGYEGSVPFEIQKKTLESWLRSNIEGELKEEEGFIFDNLAITAGEIEDESTLLSVIIRLCDDEEEAKEELEK